MKWSIPALRWLCARPSRYTQIVFWRYRISLVLLIVLTALPVSGAFCTMLCDSAAGTRAAAHHASVKPCDDEQAGTPPSGPQVRGIPGPDCRDHDGAAPLSATTTTTRADREAGPRLLDAASVHDSISNLADSGPVFDYRTPPGSTPSTAAPLVLRV